MLTYSFELRCIRTLQALYVTSRSHISSLPPLFLIAFIHFSSCSSRSLLLNTAVLGAALPLYCIAELPYIFCGYIPIKLLVAGTFMMEIAFWNREVHINQLFRDDSSQFSFLTWPTDLNTIQLSPYLGPLKRMGLVTQRVGKVLVSSLFCVSAVSFANMAKLVTSAITTIGFITEMSVISPT